MSADGEINLKPYKKTKKKKSHKETELTSEPDTAGIFELSEQRFKTMKIKTLKALWNQVDST